MVTYDDLSVAEALQRILSVAMVLPSKQVALIDSLGNVLATDIIAPNNLPSFTNSAMDGYAIRAVDIMQASQSTPVQLRVVADIAAGIYFDKLHLGQGEAARIMTGAIIPSGADAVIPVEMTDEDWQATNGDRPLPDHVKIFQSVKHGGHIRVSGDDVQIGDVVLQRGHLIRPSTISVMASLGITKVEVIRRPIVGILATGDELVEPDQPLHPGKIRNSNGYAQAAQIIAAGGIPLQLGISRDTEEDVRAKLQAGIDAGVDLFVSSAGVSVGAYDVVRSVLASEGNINFWRVRMRPGKPLAFGTYKNIPYLGLPGNPVSSIVSFWRFGRPALRKMRGITPIDEESITVKMTESMTSSGRESYIRVIISKVDNQYHAKTTGRQPSHMITSLLKANGLVIIPEDTTAVQSGDYLQAYFI